MGLPAGGSPCWGEVSLLGGLPAQGGLPAWGSPCPGVCSPYWGVLPAQGGVSLPGVSLPGGVLPARDPPVDRITDTCKNITLATTSLRLVTRMHSSRMRTVHSSGDRGGCIQACIGQGGCIPACAGRGVCTPACTAQGMSAQGAGCLHGGGVCPSACWDTPPRGQNDRCL